MTTVRDLLLEGKHRLSENGAARLESEILLANAMEVSRSYLFAHPEQDIAEGTANQYRQDVGKRERGEPIAYLTGQREFWSLPLTVSPAVLIPRPETEVLVEAALNRIQNDKRCRIADIGTGSGAIGLAIAHERPASEIHASDISADALSIARKNAEKLGIQNISFHLGSWLEGLSGLFDLIVSNPPYVAMGDPHLDQGDLRFEPEVALVSGGDGLEAIRTITSTAKALLVTGGWLGFEHGHDQADDCAAILHSNGFKNIETLKDLEGTKRVTFGKCV